MKIHESSVNWDQQFNHSKWPFKKEWHRTALANLAMFYPSSECIRIFIPMGQLSIDSVKINTCLVMMREWRVGWRLVGASSDSWEGTRASCPGHLQRKSCTNTSKNITSIAGKTTYSDHLFTTLWVIFNSYSVGFDSKDVWSVVWLIVCLLQNGYFHFISFVTSEEIYQARCG